MERTCRGTTKAGQPCRAPTSTIRPDGYCPAHSPENVAAFRAAAAKGGQGKAAAARAEKLVPAVLRPVLDTLLTSIEETKAGTLDPRVAGALSSLAGAVVKVYQVGTLEERIAALEASQEAQAGQGGRR